MTDNRNSRGMLKMHKRLAVILPLAVLALFTFSIVANPFTYALAQQTGAKDSTDKRDESVRTAEQLIKILETAEAHINNTLTNLAGRNITVPAAVKEKYYDGLTHTEAAIQYLQENRTQDAEKEIMISMSDFKDALSQFKSNDNDDNATTTTPIANGIGQAINRSRIFIDKLETIIQSVNSTEYPTAEIQSKIAQAKTILDNATILLKHGNVTEAANSLGDARRVIAGLNGDLNSITQSEKTKNIKQFADNALERLNGVESKANELLPPQAAATVKDAIDQAKQSITQALNLTDNKRLDQAVDKLEEMSKDAKDGDKKFDEGFGQDKPVVTQKLEAAISTETNNLNVLQQQINALGNVTGVEKIREMLTEAKQMLQSATQKLSNGDLQSAGKILKNMDELTGKISESIKEIAKHSSEVKTGDHSDNGDNPERGKR